MTIPNTQGGLVADRLSYRAGARPLLQEVSLELRPGELHAVLGPNGAGKTTLLRALSGDLEPTSGEIRLDGSPLAGFGERMLARRRAVLPQDDHLGFAFTAREVVALGRFAAETQRPDLEAGIVADAMQAAGAAHLADREYTRLSGGERARVRFARVMAQLWPTASNGGGNGRYLLLDEPTASLDLAHQHACMAMAGRLAQDGAGVLAVLHDPNLALRYAHRVSLLHEGRLVACGAPAEVLDARRLSTVYGVEVQVLDATGLPHPLVVVAPATPRSAS